MFIIVSEAFVCLSISMPFTHMLSIPNQISVRISTLEYIGGRLSYDLVLYVRVRFRFRERIISKG